VTLSNFTDTYFAFLLSGRAEDFRAASEAFDRALREGVPMEQLQSGMDESHTSAEMLCLMVDIAPVIGN
jgi:hypothetical protein